MRRDGICNQHLGCHAWNGPPLFHCCVPSFDKIEAIPRIAAVHLNLSILASSCNSPSSILPRSSTALLYRLSACSTPALHAAGYDFDRSDFASVEQTIRKPIKVRGKVALRCGGA